MLNIAVVGTGGRAQSHLATIPKLKDIYQLTAVCDINEERAQQAAERFGVQGYTNVEKMFDKEKIDVITIAVPPEGHHINTVLAAERGVHVISETPMSFSLECARMMLDVCEKHGTKVDVSENVRRWPNERMKRRIVESGVIGEVTQIHCCYASGIYHGISAVRNCALGEAKQVIGYCQNVQLAERHWFDPFCRRAGQGMENINTVPANPSENAWVATWEIGIADYDNGVTSVHEFPIGALRGSHWEIDATSGQIISNDVYVYEDGKRNRYPIQTVMCDTEDGRTIDYLKVDTKPEVVWENPHKRYPLSDADDIARADVLISVYKAATEDVETDYGLGGYKDLEMMIATRESAIRGSAPVKLPIQEPLLYDKIQHKRYREIYGHDPLEIIHTPPWKQEAKLSSEM
ncbi:MAG: Gfo/Idh/MocA family protein [Candidatus Poribacteria bacterium]